MPPLWCIGAARIIHDQRAATISYQDAQFEFFGVPILYTPYFQHPDPTVKHRSGFLMPTMGNSSTLGFFTEVPYYFALSPNYDFTLHPRYYSKYGMLWQGEWRHRLANGQYNIKVWGIDQENGDREQHHRGRLARVDPDARSVLAVVMVALRVGCHRRQRRGLPPLLQARPDRADGSGEHRLSAGHERPQLLRAPSSISSAAC